MKKRIIVVFMVLLACMLIPLINQLFAQVNEAEATTLPRERKYSRATIEDDFADNAVIVILNKNATRSVGNFSLADFSEIDVKSVEDLTEYSTELLQRQIIAERYGASSMMRTYDEKTRTVDNNFRQKWFFKI